MDFEKTATGHGQLIYEGSVKSLYQWGPVPWKHSSEVPQVLEFRFSDAYSVFDYGAMPDTISGKGRALCSMAKGFFIALEDPAQWVSLGSALSTLEQSQVGEALLNQLFTQGLKTHWIRDEQLNHSSELSLFAKKLSVHPPEFAVLGGEPLRRYPRALGYGRLLPLEVVFRFAAPEGSSFYGRLNEALLRRMGFERMITPQDRFSLPVIEFFTKLEPKDRYLDYERAVHYADLALPEFEQLWRRTTAVALFLRRFFSVRGLELLDGKLEWGLDERGDLILVDTIGPDELRIVEPKSGAVLSKEFLRKYYRSTEWYRNGALKDSKPPVLPKHILHTAQDIYATLARVVCAPEGTMHYDIGVDSLVERINSCHFF